MGEMWFYEEEKPRRTELYDIDWQETSFVPAGDNPPARIVMWKNAGLSRDEIEEVLQEVQMSTKDGVEARVSEMAKEAYPDLPVAAARARLWAERPDLRDAYNDADGGSSMRERAVGPVVKAERAFARIDKAARTRYPDLYDESPSQARIRVSEKQGLRTAYNEEFFG